MSEFKRYSMYHAMGCNPLEYRLADQRGIPELDCIIHESEGIGSDPLKFYDATDRAARYAIRSAQLEGGYFGTFTNTVDVQNVARVIIMIIGSRN